MDRLLKVLRKIKPEIDFINSKNLVDEGTLDSIDIVSIIIEIEKEYSIEINPSEIDPDNFQSIYDILELVEKTIGNA